MKRHAAAFALALLTQPAGAQIALAPRDLVLETGVWSINPNLETDPGQVEALRASVVREFSGGARLYENLNNEFAIRKGWLVDSMFSREKIALFSQPSHVNIYGSFSIQLKKVSYRECTSLVSDSATLARFDDVWLNERQISAAGKPACISEWPFQAGKNTLRYHAH